MVLYDDNAPVNVPLEDPHVQPLDKLMVEPIVESLNQLVDDTTISSHYMEMVHHRDEEEENVHERNVGCEYAILYDVNVHEEDDDGLQECATLTDSLVVCSSNGGIVRGSGLADNGVI